MWVDVADRLPEPKRWVKVWGLHTREGERCPVAYRRFETPGRPFWFWCSTEWRGSSGISHWWDGPADPPDRPAFVPTGPLQAGPRPEQWDAIDEGGAK